ncbi:MAG: CsbD family protein [Candidatus Binataceae bacterium]
MNSPIFVQRVPAACRCPISGAVMTTINKDQVAGRVEEAKGTIKEAAGKLVGDETLEAKGNIQKNLGKVQAKVGDIKKDLKDIAS